ncbi:dipeptide transport ATP-binding protein DppF [Klebsiella pneumoniae]|uniref:Dipeptide transport ATP-binding protein DppF n=1 Tax=Klebsiella pneumoniae TaxID=573 RepID=A0A377UVI7_KLEPN|nr:dipeptide transport ATP-binding protein DppF [Klebsiella pneumoniae]
MSRWVWPPTPCAAIRISSPAANGSGVAIARALLLRPQILLLDEPTSALDMSVQAEILNLLNRLKQEHGMTYLLVSHDADVIAHMSDRAAFMAEGVIQRFFDREALVNGEHRMR